MSQLDQEEREILEAFEAGALQKSKESAQIQQRHREYARAMLLADAEVQIRLSSRDLQGLQERALAEGIPYETLITGILHKYVEGRLQEVNP